MPKAPVWSDLTNSIYYVNFKTIWKQSSIHRYDATDKSTHSAYIKGYSSPAFIAPLTKECKDLFVVGAGHDIVIVRWDGKSKKATVESKILSIEADEDDRVIEDARVDPSGRLYFGTFTKSFCGPKNATGRFYMYTEEGGVQQLDTVYSTGGLGFDEKEQAFYRLDTCKAIIQKYDWNPKTGRISNEYFENFLNFQC